MRHGIRREESDDPVSKSLATEYAQQVTACSVKKRSS